MADIGTVNLDLTLAHHIFQIQIVQRASQIPTDVGQNDVFFDAVPFEVNDADNLSVVD